MGEKMWEKEMSDVFLWTLLAFSAFCFLWSIYVGFRDQRKWITYLDNRLFAAEDAMERMSAHPDVMACSLCREKYLKWKAAKWRKAEGE